jgi:hypothetical protein
VDDADLQVVDERDDVGFGVGPADAFVVELAIVAEGDAAGGVDDVAADAVVGVGGAVAGGGFGPGGVGGSGGGPVREGAVRPLLVVIGGERVELGLQFGPGRGLGGPRGQPFLQGLPEPLDLALGLRLTGQSGSSLWISRCRAGLLPGPAACAFEAADVGGDGFEAAAKLVDLDGEAGQRGGVASAGAVLVDDGAQVGPPVEGGPADAGARGDLAEGGGLPGGGEFGAGGLDRGGTFYGQVMRAGRLYSLRPAQWSLRRALWWRLCWLRCLRFSL